MGGLAHYLESAGLATTQISLVRLHSEIIRPPRALWVPFELGRPFGPPRDAAFQTRVVRAALELLERSAGPLLEDFPDESPAPPADEAAWSCPVNFTPPPQNLSGDAALAAALADEFARLVPWYERSVEALGRTTVGACPIAIEAVCDYFRELLTAADAPPPIAALQPADAIRLAAEDLKAFYFEAAAAQPGAASSARLTAWFWHETHAGGVLRTLKERFAASADPDLVLLGQLLLVPRVALDP
ncbi:MAG: hypothetical protein RLW62_11930 [Gammaproteobacteria bacterium]